MSAYLRQRRAWTACLKDEEPSSLYTGAPCFGLSVPFCKELQGWRRHEMTLWDIARVEPPLLKCCYKEWTLDGAVRKHTFGHNRDVGVGFNEVIKIWRGYVDAKIKWFGMIHLENVHDFNQNWLVKIKKVCFMQITHMHTPLATAEAVDVFNYLHLHQI